MEATRTKIEIALKFSSYKAFLILLRKFNLKMIDFKNLYDARQKLIDCIIDDLNNSKI
jgi:hypothetical protein